MINVFDVAAYILSKIGETTTMKLQKLVYYCQAWSLAWDDVPLFEEECQAWAAGPVFPTLYNKHRGQFKIGGPNSTTLPVSGTSFQTSQLATMDTVLEYYGDKEPHWLSELTHKEAPWRKAREGVALGEQSQNIISKESMRDYYISL